MKKTKKTNSPGTRKRTPKDKSPSDATVLRPTAPSTLDPDLIGSGNLTSLGGRQMEEELEAYHSVSPVLSGDDVDARWQSAEGGGEESVGGHAPTPDQDIVDELGRAAGIEFQDNQPLRTHDEVLADRDQHRWELDPRSAEDLSEHLTETDSLEDLESPESPGATTANRKSAAR